MDHHQGQGGSPSWRTVAGWHGKAPNDEEYKTAMDELKAAWQKWRGCKMADVKKIATRDSYGSALAELGAPIPT